ncbi:ABC transporter ATP-binding protein [Chitinimonas sp.]|uniref:ABC transporter ATP-binding protein n=1 Tax=Chitinimonas sp. TaxID=1934313 RepID=UPI002F95B21D
MIELSEVSKTFGQQPAVERLSLTVARGEFLVLLGASGSGKSTTLRLCNRLLEPDSGSIHFAGTDLRSFEPHVLRRRMGYAIQSVGLFPHWTVAQNIATVPQLLRWSKARIAARVEELLSLLHLDPATFKDRYPHALSGGQQQRVGVARALAAEPEVLLMDEPFGALDPVTRQALQEEIARIHRVAGTTILMVTHDVDEALRLADRLVLMQQGRVLQQGSPAALLAPPLDTKVAQMLGGRELGLRRLALQTVASRARPELASPGPSIAADANLREALDLMLQQACDHLNVHDAAGQPIGRLYLADLAEAGA